MTFDNSVFMYRLNFLHAYPLVYVRYSKTMNVISSNTVERNNVAFVLVFHASCVCSTYVDIHSCPGSLPNDIAIPQPRRMQVARTSSGRASTR